MCDVPLPENELRASSKPIVAQLPLMFLGSPHGARLLNFCDASAKSSKALAVLASDTLLNASPASLLNLRRTSLTFGQSTSTWVTISCAPHTH